MIKFKNIKNKESILNCCYEASKLDLLMLSTNVILIDAPKEYEVEILITILHERLNVDFVHVLEPICEKLAASALDYHIF